MKGKDITTKIEACAVGASAVMLALQICQVIDWPWYIVCGPAMLVFALYAVLLLIGGAIALTIGTNEDKA